MAAAICQSLAFIFSRLTAIRFNGKPFTILCMAHCIMGVMSLFILPFLNFKVTPEVMPHIGIILAMSGTYLAGMGFFFQAIKSVDASRATPILGMKVVFIALLMIFFENASFSIWQWLAIALTTTSVFFLNISGSTIPWKSTLLILTTAFLYASSDMFIKKVIVVYEPLGKFNGLAFACIVNFIVCGIVSTIFLFFLPNKKRDVWKGSFYFALAFFSANFLVFYSFSVVGVVFGNIAMSTRGIFSILLGASLVYMGIHDLESKVSKKVVIGRFIAGVMMTASIALFSLK